MRFRLSWTSLLLLSALACGGNPTQPSAPPLASFIISPQGDAIVGITEVTFQASVDPSAQATYSWRFGDGATASGSTATHVYDQTGTFSVVLTAANRDGTATASGLVTARSLTGLWWPDFFYGPCFALRLAHSGSRVDAVAFNGSAAVVTIRSPRDITLTIAASTPAEGCGALQYSGVFDATLDSFTVSIGATKKDTWRRQ